MNRHSAAMVFLRSREGFGWLVILAFAGVLAGVAAYGFYDVSLRSFVEDKTDEKVMALELVDAFVSNYSDARGAFKADSAPVPATFRAHSIALFNQTRGSANALRLRWIGREGRAIVTPPSDPEMAATIESFVGKSVPTPVSELLTIRGEQIFRTVYPSIAREQSCVNCHNSLQPSLHWKLNDVMGAFSLDVPVGPFLHALRLECGAIGLVVFFLIGGIGLLISLNHHRRIAEREAARERAETASRAKSAFLATMSHELRTPLNAIIGFSEMMLQEVLGEFRHEHYRAYTADIHESGAHLLQIINDILDLSNAEAGKLELYEDVFDLRDTLRSVRNLTGERLRAAGLTENSELSPDLPLLRGDEVKIKQVLMNLVGNAIKFTPSGGNIALSGTVDRRGLTITIADTGIGIPPEYLERVLEAFEQVDSSLAREHEGAGLGLPLAKAIMELHGGVLDLKSTQGVGTQVAVTFPRERLVFDLLTPSLRPAA
jgi:signal transduction histidine kinase